jgi:formyl-CoA transferase
MAELPTPYQGLFVLDAAQGIAGPFCGMQLAACGADVVKLEPPAGDWSRGLGTREGSQSVMHVAYNRGKRSLVLDLQTPAGRAACAKLTAKADVLIEAFRPGVAARLGLVPEATKPDAVCLSVSGFGQGGPYAERPCTDGVMQAFSGLSSNNLGNDGVPHKHGTLIVDVFTGLSAFAAVQAALAEQARDRAAGAPPRRRVLDVSLLSGAASLLAFNIAEHGLLGTAPEQFNVPAGSYQASCGGFVAVALLRETDWMQMCAVLERPNLAADPRFLSFADRAANRTALLVQIRRAFLERTAEDWVARFQAARMLCDRINTPVEWLRDPQVVATGAAPVLDQPGLGAVPMPALPGIGHWAAPAPALGQHSAAVLADLGL